MTTEYTKTKTSTEQVQEQATRLPEGAIPVEEAGLLPPSKQEDVISMRLEAEKFKFRIWRTLAGYVHKEIDGEDYLVPTKHFKGVVSSDAAFNLCQQIEYWVNQVVGLAHTTYDEAILLWEDAINSLVALLAVEDEFKNISYSQKRSLMSGFKTLLWHQATRAVEGREAKNLITRINEDRGEQTVKQSFSADKGFKFPRGAGGMEVGQ